MAWEKERLHMKKPAVILSLILSASFLLSSASSVLAASSLTFFLEDVNPDSYTLPTDQELMGLFTKTARNITIEGNIIGDSYLAGGIINIDGRVEGDVLAVGSIINISGEVTEDVRLVAGVININGTVHRNATLIGGSIRVGPNAIIKGSVLGLGKEWDSRGSIGQYLKYWGKNVNLAGYIGKDAEVTSKTIQIANEAIIEGDLTSSIQEESQISARATIRGEHKKGSFKEWADKAPLRVFREDFEPIMGKVGQGFRATKFLFSLLIGILLYKIAPRQIKAVSKLVAEHFGQNLLLGFLVLVSTPLLIVLLTVSILGIPLAFALMFALLGLVAFYEIPVAFYFGPWIFKQLGQTKKKNKLGILWQFAAGLLIMELLFIIPILGGLAKVTTLILTTGAVSLFLKEAYIKLRH